MDIKEIRAFILLAEHLHFGHTAKLLNLTQPALTKQIHRLETFFGSSLFERTRKGTRLTSFGLQFLKEAQGFITHYEQLCLLGQKISAGEQGLLRIGFGLYMFEMVPRLIVQFRQSAPGITLTLQDFSTHEQLEALRNRQLDIGFVKLSEPTELDSLLVTQEQLALITPNQSSLKKVIHLSQCVDVPFVIISRDRSPVLHNQILKLCAQYGFHPRIIQEVSEVTNIMALVKAGLGISVLPPSFFSPGFTGLSVYPQEEPAALWSVFAAWRKGDTNPALAAFLNLLRAEVGSNA